MKKSWMNIEYECYEGAINAGARRLGNDWIYPSDNSFFVCVILCYKKINLNASIITLIRKPLQAIQTSSGAGIETLNK